MYFSNDKGLNISALLFILFTVFYILIEVIFNFTLLQELSIGSSEKTIDRLEFFGKIMSGLGAGLLFTRIFIDDANDSVKKFFKIFSISCLWGFAFAFTAQTLIIKSIVYFGDDEDKAKALLTTQVSNIIVPYFNNSAYGEESTLTAQEYFQTARKCSEQVNLKVDGTLNKTVFQYQTFKNNFDEDLYKGLVKNHQDCLIETLTRTQIEEPELPKDLKTKVQLRDDLFNEYLTISNNYLRSTKIVKEFYANDKSSNSERNKQKSLNRYKQNYDVKIKELLKDRMVSVPPNLSKKEFLNLERVKFLLLITPSIESANERFNDNLMREIRLSKLTIFDVYDLHRPFISELNLDDKESLEKITKEESKMADQAYKAIIMPVVALFFSILLLAVNIVSLLIFVISRVESYVFENLPVTKFCQIAWLGVLTWLVTLPSMFKVPEINTQSHFVDLTFSYEKYLIKFYETDFWQLILKILSL